MISVICMENFRRRKEKNEIPALGFIAHMDTVSDFCDQRSDRWLPKIMMAGIWYLAQADWY